MVITVITGGREGLKILKEGGIKNLKGGWVGKNFNGESIYESENIRL
jgi:hypothetical protein